MGVAASSSSVVRLRAGVEVVDASTQVSYVLPLIAVEYIVLRVDAELDSSNRNPYVGDTLVVLEAKFIQFAKNLSEIAAVSDAQIVLRTDKSVEDEVSVEDVLTKSAVFSRSFDEEATVEDVFAKAVAFSRSFADEIIISEVATVEVSSVGLSKLIFDTVTAGSSGSLISQGYCDITYFAEDYVGESRTFT